MYEYYRLNVYSSKITLVLSICSQGTHYALYPADAEVSDIQPLIVDSGNHHYYTPLAIALTYGTIRLI